MPQIANALNDRMSIRISTEDKQTLIRAVALTHTNITEFVLQRILPSAREIIQQYDNRQFSPQDLSLIMELLDNPPKANTKLQQAAKLAKESYHEE
ncbi:DUF1778 domain-containing protein [Glaesserella parasuis]|uniref:DUF1778 domain-containing protein n=5 Tax=Glaesserella parasuis TaxID=738 RepID=A0A084EAD9_GLAPU|nr:DUF1778 domain-containing protein [Glaesserella parasuis]AGO15870.1 putative ABC-type transporter [Glaesserella parasuis ZJ0906]EQA02500.1 hypothetical protein HPSMNH_0489 [Glaesserella parasuis MN-H]EQA06914.1 hypothetical protein HPSH465_1426 [Glaesserella parasuis H465]EQA13794.1 hypothetical protein HPSSW140_0725 [Glaesserella parasuis SW140]EQA14167.1 hypothetical protein HPS174_0639 [Glaesserella parasuis 174]